jgi:hypothetical protein
VKHVEIVNLREGGGVLDAGHRSSPAEVTVALDGVQRDAKVRINGVGATGRGGVLEMNVNTGAERFGR